MRKPQSAYLCYYTIKKQLCPHLRVKKSQRISLRYIRPLFMRKGYSTEGKNISRSVQNLILTGIKAGKSGILGMKKLKAGDERNDRIYRRLPDRRDRRRHDDVLSCQGRGRRPPPLTGRKNRTLPVHRIRSVLFFICIIKLLKNIIRTTICFYRRTTQTKPFFIQ